MKVRATYNKLQTAGAVAILALGVNSQAAAIPVFTVDANNAFGPGHGTGPFQADFILGNSSTLVTLNSGGPNISSGEGWVNFSSFTLGGNPIMAFDSGLNNNWSMWAEFTYTLSLASGTYATPGSTYTVTGLHATFWADPTLGTSPTFISATNAGGAASVLHNADTVEIAHADLIAGVANINLLGGTSFNATTAFALDNPNGPALFTSPTPFYDLLFNEFNNTSSGSFINIAENYITINQATGGVDFNQVPEPATLALLGIGFLAIGAFRKRRKA